jgi:hypothetical protein
VSRRSALLPTVHRATERDIIQILPVPSLSTVAILPPAADPLPGRRTPVRANAQPANACPSGPCDCASIFCPHGQRYPGNKQ